jgi:DNA-binding MarR family transcriptional regulator
VNVDEHIVEILVTTGGGPLTIGDLAGRLGISPSIVVLAARRLVDHGPASPSFVRVDGIPTLHWITASPDSQGRVVNRASMPTRLETNLHFPAAP